MSKHRKGDFLPGWSEVAPPREPITQEDLAKHYGHARLNAEQRAKETLKREGREPVIFSRTAKAIVGSVWQGKPSGIPGWDKRARESSSNTKDKWARRAEQKRKHGNKCNDRPKTERILYLAYGSNLHKRTMKQRCPTAVSRGTMLLNNARLVFRGVADVVPEFGCSVPVGVWEIGPEDERALDRYEGVASGIYSKYYIPLGGNSKQKALIYMMNDEGVFPPSAWYAGIMRNGYRNFNMDESYLDAAIKDSFENKLPSNNTRRRRAKQRSGDVQRHLVDMPQEIAEQHWLRTQELREQTMLAGPEPTTEQLKQIERETAPWDYPEEDK